jgi:hypothetical protein
MLLLGGLHVKHAEQRRIVATNSALVLEPRKTMESLHRVGRSQEHPDVNWLPVSSLAFHSAQPNMFPICAVALFEEKIAYLFLQVSRYSSLAD